jgi:transglutaminase-like putative cysteine protease
VQPEPVLLIGVHALVWCAAYTTAEILARARAVLPALVPALVVLTLGAFYGAGTPQAAVPAAGGYLLVALVLLLGRHRPAGLAVAVAVTALALGLAPMSLAGRSAFDPRARTHPAGQPRTDISPLDQVASWLSAPEQPLFTVAASRPENWRLAVLDRFDGRTWRTDDTFLATGARVPAAGPGTALTQQVTIDELTGPWLPAAASPVSVTGIAVLADPRTGVLRSRDTVEVGARYEVTSRVPRLSPDDAAAAVPATDAVARQALELPPGLPEVVRQAADAATATAGTPFQQASGLERYLRSTARNDPGAAPGHAYGHLAYFLAVSHRGTSEQFATAFAVMARALGLPSRIVVGFGPGEPAGTDEWLVRGGDALVWPEVDFAGLGWVPFYPTPQAGPAGTGGPAAGQSVQREQLDQAVGTPAPPAVDQPRPTPAVVRPPARSTWRPVAVGAGAAAGTALAGYLGVVLLAPAVRMRRRRRAADPAVRVAGAWREALRLLRRVGPVDVGTLTTHEIAARAAERLGPGAPAALLPLARLADRAAFSREPAGPSVATAAWEYRDALVPLVSRRLGRWGTVRRRLGPGALRG